MAANAALAQGLLAGLSEEDRASAMGTVGAKSGSAAAAAATSATGASHAGDGLSAADFGQLLKRPRVPSAGQGTHGMSFDFGDPLMGVGGVIGSFAGYSPALNALPGPTARRGGSGGSGGGDIAQPAGSQVPMRLAADRASSFALTSMNPQYEREVVRGTQPSMSLDFPVITSGGGAAGGGGGGNGGNGGTFFGRARVSSDGDALGMGLGISGSWGAAHSNNGGGEVAGGVRSALMSMRRLSVSEAPAGGGSGTNHDANETRGREGSIVLEPSAWHEMPARGGGTTATNDGNTSGLQGWPSTRAAQMPRGSMGDASDAGDIGRERAVTPGGNTILESSSANRGSAVVRVSFSYGGNVAYGLVAAELPSSLLDRHGLIHSSSAAASLVVPEAEAPPGRELSRADRRAVLASRSLWDEEGFEGEEGEDGSAAFGRIARRGAVRSVSAAKAPSSAKRGGLRGRRPGASDFSGDSYVGRRYEDGSGPDVTRTICIGNIELPVVPIRAGFVGAYSLDSRLRRIERFMAKRQERVWEKVVKYDVRKSFADQRLRVKGRFVKKEVRYEATLLSPGYC
jgi:hypothetical protein